MSTMLAVDEELAAVLRGVLPEGTEDYDDWDVRALPQLMQSSAGPRELASAVARKNPQVLMVGVRLGGNAYSAIEGIKLVLDAPKPPAVIVLTPKVTKAVASELRAMGVYQVIGTRGLSAAALVEKATEEIFQAAAWRNGVASAEATQSPNRRPPRAKRRAS